MSEERKSRKRRAFTDEFKRDAAALVIDTGRPIAHVARELGVYESSLGRWVAKERAARGGDDGLVPLDADERAELASLKSEVTELRRERDLLKRSVAFWVKETSTR